MAAQSPFIRVSQKQTDEADWENPIRKWIAVNYMQDPELYRDECYQLQRLRQDVRGAGRDITGRDLLYRYYGQLELLDQRFPVDEYHVKVMFNWYDAFSKKPTAQHSLAYEKACILFNLAACISAIASAQPRLTVTGAESNPQAASLTFKSLQACAGIFTYVNDNFLHAPTTDLSKDTVKVLASLMLAQAQECLLERGEGKGENLRAKLAGWLSWQYASVYDGINEGLGKGVFFSDWAKLVQIKQKYFTALAHRHRANACHNERLYGEVVARLRAAEQYSKEAFRLAQQFSNNFSHHACPTIPPDAGTSLCELTRALHIQLLERLSVAEKDNDMIYHASVPQVDALPPLDKSCGVKPMSMSDLYAEGEIQRIIGAPIFQRLIPLKVHEQASVYSEDKAKLVREVTEKCEQADAELVGVYAFMRLPKSLERFRGDGSVVRMSSELLEPKDEIRGIAGWIHVEEDTEGRVLDLAQQLEVMRQGARETADEVEKLLDEEATEWQSMKTKYGDMWTQSPPDPALRDDLRQHRTHLEKAAESDRKVAQLLQENKESFYVLSMGPRSPELEKLYTESATAGADGAERRRPGQEMNLLELDHASQLSSLVNRVEEITQRLERLKKERNDTLVDLRAKVQQDDIQYALLAAHRRPTNEEQLRQLFDSELEKFRAHRQRLMQALLKQQQLVGELTEAFKNLVDSSDGRHIVRGWERAEKGIEELERRLKSSGEAYREVKESLKKGIHFYADLSEFLQALLHEAREQISRRRSERQRLARDVESSRLYEKAAPARVMSPIQQQQQTSSSAVENFRMLEERFAKMNLKQPQPQAPPPPMPQQQPPYRPYPQQQQQPPQYTSAYASQPSSMAPTAPGLPLERSGTYPDLPHYAGGWNNQYYAQAGYVARPQQPPPPQQQQPPQQQHYLAGGTAGQNVGDNFTGNYYHQMGLAPAPPQQQYYPQAQQPPPPPQNYPAYPPPPNNQAYGVVNQPGGVQPPPPPQQQQQQQQQRTYHHDLLD